MKRKILVFLSAIAVILGCSCFIVPKNNIATSMAAIGGNQEDLNDGAGGGMVTKITGLASYETFVKQVNTAYANGEVFSKYYNVTIILETNLDFTKVSASDMDSYILEYFYGTFDGQFYTIKGLPMFCKKNGGTIQNVNFDQSTNTSYYTRVENEGTENLVMPWYGMGAIAGVNYNTIQYCGVTNATITFVSDNISDITDYDPTVNLRGWPYGGHGLAVGGIAGINMATISYCGVYDSVITTSQNSSDYEDNNCAGGICGYFAYWGGANGSALQTPVSIEHCISVCNKISAEGFATLKSIIRLNLNNITDEYATGAIFGVRVYDGVESMWSLIGPTRYPVATGLNVSVSYCFSKGNTDKDGKNKIKSIGSFVDQWLDGYFTGTTLDTTDGIIRKGADTFKCNFHDNDAYNKVVAIANGKISSDGRDELLWRLKTWLGDNAPDTSISSSVKIISNCPLWYSSSDLEIPKSEDWWTSAIGTVGTAQIMTYTDTSMSDGTSQSITLRDNGTLLDDNIYWRFPTSVYDHCGYPYLAREVDVTVKKFKTSSTSTAGSNLEDYKTVAYGSLNLSTDFYSLQSIGIGGTYYTLQGFKAKDTSGNVLSGYIAQSDGEINESIYPRSVAQFYPIVYPVYSKSGLNITFRYDSANLGNESNPLTITVKSGTTSYRALTSNNKSFSASGLSLSSENYYSLNTAITFDITTESNIKYSLSNYYIKASIKANGDSPAATLSNGYGIGKSLSVANLGDMCAKDTLHCQFNLTGNMTDKREFSYTITLTVYKKVELKIVKDNSFVSELGSGNTINNMAESDVDWSSVSGDYFSYYVLEGTDLIWWQSGDISKYYNTSERTYKKTFGSSTQALYYNESVVLGSDGRISAGSEGNALYNSLSIFNGYSGKSMSQPFYILYGVPTAMNENIEYTLNFVQTGDFMEIGNTKNPTQNSATATINYIKIDAWTVEAQDAGSDPGSYYLTTGGLLTSYEPDAYGYTFKTGQSITFKINSTDYDTPRVILIVNGVSKINAELSIDGDSPLYNIGSINIGISVKQDWSPEESIHNRRMLTTIIGSENLTKIEESSITTAKYDTADEYYYATRNIMASFDKNATAYLHIAEVIKITLDNSAVSKANQTVYAINGTLLDTTSAVTVPTNVDHYYYYTDDSRTTYADDQTNETFTCKDGKLTVVDDDGMNDMKFYRVDEGGYYAQYPNITVKAVKGEAQEAKSVTLQVYYSYSTKNSDGTYTAMGPLQDYSVFSLTKGGCYKIIDYRGNFSLTESFKYIDSYLKYATYTVGGDSSFISYFNYTSFQLLWTNNSGVSVSDGQTFTLTLHFVPITVVEVTYQVKDNATGDIRGSKDVTYTTAYDQRITTDFVYGILSASSGVKKITGLEKGTTTNNCISYVGSETTPGTDSDPGEEYLVVKINSVTKDSTAIITIYVDFETTTTETETGSFTYQYKFVVYVNGVEKGSDVFKVPYTYTGETVTLGTPTVTNGSPSGQGYYYSSGSTKQYTIKHSNWGTYSSCTNDNTYTKLDCNGLGSYFDANIVNPTVAELKLAASNNSIIIISVYYTVETETTFTLTLIPRISGTTTEISSGKITKKEITLTKDDVGKTFIVFSSLGNIKDDVTCYPTEFTNGEQFYKWYQLSTDLDVITINNTNTLISTLYGNSFTYNSHSTSVTSGDLYVYYKQVYKLTLTARVINYGTESVDSSISKDIYSGESWNVSITDFCESGQGSIYKIEYPTGKTSSDMSYTIDGDRIKVKTLTTNQAEDVYIYMYASDQEYGEAKIRVTYKYYTDSEYTTSKDITVAGLTNPYEETYAADCDDEVTIDSIQTPKLTGYTYESYELVSDECSLFERCDEDEIWFNVLSRGVYGFVDICVYYVPESFILEVVLNTTDYDGSKSKEQIFYDTITYAQIGTLVVDKWLDMDSNYSYIDANLECADCFEIDGGTDLMIELLSWVDTTNVTIFLNYEYDVFVLEVSYLDTANNKIAEPIEYYFNYSDLDGNVGTYYKSGTLLKSIVAKDISGYTFSKFTNGIGIDYFIDGAYKIMDASNKAGYHTGRVTAVYQSTLPTVTELISKDDGVTKTDPTTHTNVSSGTTFTAESINGYQFIDWEYDSSAFTLSGDKKTLTLTATSGNYEITKKYKPNNEYVAKITFNVHISQGTTATQSTSQKVTATYGLTPNPFQNVGATAINQDVTGTYDYHHLMGETKFNLSACVSVNFGDRAKFTSTNNVPYGMTISGTTFNDTQVTLTSAVKEDVAVGVYYNIDSTNVTYEIKTIIDGNEVKTDKTKTLTLNYLTDFATSQDIIEYGVTGCSVSVSYSYSNKEFLPVNDTVNKQLTTPSSLDVSGISGDQTVTITLTYTTSTATITFIAQGPGGLNNQVTKHIYYNGYTGWGRNDNDSDKLNVNTSYSASDIFGTIANYTSPTWELGDNADKFFTLTDNDLKTQAEYTDPTPTATVIANYTPVAVTMTFKIVCDGTLLKEEEIAYYYHVGLLASNPTNVQNFGYTDGLKNNVLTIYEDYGDYYCFKEWSITPNTYGKISDKTLTLNTAKENETWSDFTVTAIYRKAKVTIELNHTYTDDTDDTTNTYDYYYYKNMLCVAGKFDPVGDDNFNIDQDEGTIYFNDKHTGKTGNAKDYNTTVWNIDNNKDGIVENNNWGNNQNVQLSTLDDFVDDYTITVTATHTAHMAKILVYDASDTTKPINFTINGTTYNSYNHYYKTESATIDNPTKTNHTFTDWELEYVSGSIDFAKLVTINGTTATLNQVESCTNGYELQLIAKFKSNGEYTCGIKIEYQDENGKELGSKTLTFYYLQDGTATDSDVYLESEIINPTLTDYVFLGWQDGDTNVFTSATSGVIKNSVTDINNESIIKITAKFHSAVAKIVVTNKYGESTSTTNLNFHYTTTGASTSTDVYLGSELPTTDIAGYKFSDWGGGDTNVFTTATSGKIKETVTGVDYNSTINITANYSFDTSSVTITFKGYVYRDYVEDDNLVETQTFAGVYYYNQTSGSDYYNGQEVSADSLIEKFNFATSETLRFVEWDDGSSDSSITLSGTSSITIEVYYTYEATYSATFNVYYKYRENSQDSTASLLKTKTYTFGKTTSNPLWNDVIVNKDDFNDYGEFKKWEITKETGAGDYTSWFAQNTDNIMTGSRQPTLEAEVYIINIYAILDINRADVTIKYKNQSTNTDIKTDNYAIYYKGNTRVDKNLKVATLSKGETVYSYLSGYVFQNWESTSGDFATFFEKVDDNLQVKDTSKIAQKGIISIDITAYYLPDDYTTIIVKEIRDEVEFSVNQKTYVFHYNATSVSGDGNVKVGDNILADATTGYTFAGWDLGENADYFTKSGNNLTLKKPTNPKAEITITKMYISNKVSITYNRYYQKIDGTYQTSTTIYSYDYESNTLTIVSGSNCAEKSGTKWKLINSTTFNAYNNYVLKETKVVAEDGTTYTDINGLASKFVEYSNGELYVYNKGGVTSGGYAITVERIYDRPEAILYIKLNLLDENGNKDTNINPNPADWALTGLPTYITSINADTPYLIYYYKNGGGYTFPTSYTSSTHQYTFVDWQISKSYGDDNWGAIFNEGKMSSYTTLTANQTEDVDSLYVLTLTARFKKVVNKCEITVEYVDENGAKAQNPTSYTYYYDTTGKATGNTLYKDNTLTAPTIYGYSFSQWEITQGLSFMSANGSKISFSQPSNAKGEYTATIKAKYTRNYATINVSYNDKVGNKLQDTTTYKFYYGIAGTGTTNELFKGAQITAPTIAEYKFEKWTTSGATEFAGDNSNPMTLKSPNSATGNPTLNMTAVYSKSTCTILIENRLFNNSSIILGSQEYEFHYTTTGTMTAKDIYLGNTISPKTFTGYTFAGSWDYLGNYFEKSGNDLKVKNSISTTPTGKITVIAYYVEDVVKIEISHIDHKGNAISDVEDRVIKYYYNGTNKIDGMTYNTSDDSQNIVSPIDINGYNFVGWEKSSSYLSLSDDGKVLKINKIEDKTGEQTISVKAIYKAQSDIYYEIKIDYVHYESEYYKGTTATVGSKTYKYYFYSKKLTLNDNIVTSIANDTISNFTFVGYKGLSDDMANILTLSGSNTLLLFDKDKISGFSFNDYKAVSSNINSKAEFVNRYIAKQTFANALTVNDISGQTNIEELDGKTFSVTAYYSQAIMILDGWVSNISEQTVNNIPVYYKIDNNNFVGGVYNEDITRTDIVSETITGKIVWTGEDQRYLYSSIIIGLDNDLTIGLGSETKDYTKVFTLDVSGLRPTNEQAQGMYHPQHYHFVGWGEYVPSWTQYFVSNPIVYAYPYGDAEGTNEIQANNIKTYIDGLEYDVAQSREWDSAYQFVVYMQWEADEHTITIYKDRNIATSERETYNYISTGGVVGTVINQFTETCLMDTTYLAEMEKRIGKIDGWTIVKMSNDSQILDASGNALQIGDTIYDKCLYAGTYGNFELKPHFSSYTNLTVKFDYGTSVSGVGTLDAVYNNTTRSGNVFELTAKYQYDQEFEFENILNNKYKDPSPLSVKYGDVTYYLAGWTTKNINFNPENWASANSNTYIGLLKDLLGNASNVSFRRDCLDYETVLADGTYILSYDNASFQNLAGNLNGTITLYAVWLPYYEIIINTTPMGTTTPNADLYVGNNKQSVKETIVYGATLQRQSVNFYYDIRTSYGATPQGSGYTLALEGKELTKLNIIYTVDSNSTTFYYQLGGWYTTKAQYQDWSYSGYTRTFNVATMMTKFVSRITEGSHSSVRQVNIYPVWEDATIKVDVIGKTKTNSTTISLTGEYTLDAETISNYSIDYLTTNSGKKLDYLYGVDFINFLKYNNPSYGEKVLGDMEVVNTNKSQYMYLQLTAQYVGDLYFLRINSIEYNGLKNDNDNKLRCDDAIDFATASKNYITFTIKNGKMSANQSNMPYLIGFKKVTSKQNKTFSDYSTIYDEWKYKIISYEGKYYLAVVYGDDVYSNRSPYSLLWQQVTRSDGSELEYYLYNDKYAYDVFDTSVARDNEYSITINSNGKRVFKTNGITCPTDWKYEDGIATIYAVWRVKKYHVDLSTAFDNGTRVYSNSAYLVAQAVDYNATSDSEKYKYYVLNYEYNSTTSVYQFVLYTMNKSQFTSKSRWYGGWDTLGLSGIKDTTDNKNSRITVTYGTELTIWVYDQSKDINSKLVGYRLNSVDLREQGQTNATNFKVGNTGYLTCKDIDQNNKNYVTTDAYATLFDFKEVALDNNFTIKYQAITEYIKYALEVKTDANSGGVAIRKNGKETATMSEYKYVDLTLGEIVNATYKTNLGYQIINWTLNGQNVETQYSYVRTITAEYLATWMYAGQLGGYSVEYQDGKDYQEIGLLYVNSDTIDFDLRINIFDENNNKLETYLLSEKSNGIVALFSVDGADKVAKTKLSVVNDYAVTIVPTSHNGYLCYQFGGQDYAIINMLLSGKSKVFVNQTYSFPTISFEESVLKFDSSTLSNLVSYSAGVVVSADSRIIDINLNVATIFEINAGTNAEFEEIKDAKDRNKGSRKLVANTTCIASAEQDKVLTNNGNKAYAYYGQSIELWLEANEKYYSGGTIFVDDQVYDLALQEPAEIVVTSNVVAIANFVPVTLSYSVTLKYNDNSYYKSNMNEITNLSGVQILSEYPTYSTLNQNNEEIVDVVCDDILRLEFGLDNFNSAIFTDGELTDYTYLIYVNGTRQQLSNNDIYNLTFDGNIDVVIEIVANTGNVRVLSNIYEASEIVVVTSTGKKQTINQNTVSFDLSSGERMTIYTKDNAGYDYRGVIFNNGNLTTIIRTNSTDENYIGWKKFDLITSYNTNYAGTYEIVYEAQKIDIDLQYAIDGEICEDNVAGTGYYTDKEQYVISDYLTIYKPENGENEGYKFVGYSISGATTTDVLQGGKEQVTISLSDYADFLDKEEGYKLTIYINFICQYKISISLDGDDFGQTDVKLSLDTEVIAQSTSASTMSISTKYLDETSYSKQKFELKIKSKDTKNYHFVAKVNGEELIAGDDYIVMKIAETDDVYEGQYIFELNSNLAFTIKYLPRQYNVVNTIYEITNVDTLNKYQSGEEIELPETDDSQLKIETKTDSNYENCYGTRNTLTFTITEKEPAYTDFALLHIKVNGIIQQVRVSTTETDGIKTYIYTIDYDIKDDTNIEIVLKRVYGVEIEQ